MNRMTRKEWLLLSRYIDGDLSEEQRQRTETRLQADDAFKAAYEELWYTRQVLRSVRPQRVPHSYTLNKSQIGVRSERTTPVLFFRYSSAAAALVAVLALAVQLFMPRMAAIPAVFDAAQPEMMLQAAPMEEGAITATPPIIIWNPSYATGKGGGGGEDAQPYAAIQPTPETSTSGWGVGGGGAAPESAAPLEETVPMQEESMDEAVAADENLVATAAPQEVANPILGVAAPQEQGEVLAETPAPQTLRASKGINLFQLDFVTIAIVAGAMAIVSGVVASFLHHKKQ
ncbi:MAG: transposase [Chloroflexi bacterium]|nr:transposase [Chloroflexota bacterium]